MRCLCAYEMQLCHSMPIPCHIYDECYMDILNYSYPCIIWTIISLNIQFPNKPHNTCQHIIHKYIDIYKSSPIKQWLTLYSRLNYDTMSTNSLQPSHAMALFMHKHITSQTIRTHNLASTQFQPSISLNSSNDILQSYTNCNKNLDTNH